MEFYAVGNFHSQHQGAINGIASACAAMVVAV